MEIERQSLMPPVRLNQSIEPQIPAQLIDQVEINVDILEHIPEELDEKTENEIREDDAEIERQSLMPSVILNESIMPDVIQEED